MVRGNPVQPEVIFQNFEEYIIHNVGNTIDLVRCKFPGVAGQRLDGRLPLSCQRFQLNGSQFRIFVIEPFVDHDVGWHFC